MTTLDLPTPPVVMTFAATDPTSGAGLQADILTLASLGCHPLSVVTGITVQDTAGIDFFQPVDPELLYDQARQVLEDIPVSAFKIGLVGDVDNLHVIADIISDYPETPVIVDPVLSSGRGDDLANDEVISAIKSLIVPQATIITPNSIEARRLFNDIYDESMPVELAAKLLIELGAQWVLIKGSHENTPKINNLLFNENGLHTVELFDRIPGSFHGTGCTLASAIAANLAHEIEIEDAVSDAQRFTWHAVQFGYRPGMGQAIPDRFFWMQFEDDIDDACDQEFDDAPSPEDIH